MSSNKSTQKKPASRSQILGITAIIAIALGIGFAASYSLSKKNSPVKKAGNMSTYTRLADKNGKPVYEVALKKGIKEPIDLLISTGDYIQFNSKDGREHQIIQGASTKTEHGGDPHVPSPLDSGVIKADEGYLLQFNNIGKFEFHDNYDHNITITIIAYDPNKKAGNNKIQ